MSALRRLLHDPFCVEPIDSWLSRWGCAFGAVTLPALAVIILREYASTPFEFLVGIGAALVAALLLILLGVLSAQVHLAVRDGKAPWRSRVMELASHGG